MTEAKKNIETLSETEKKVAKLPEGVLTRVLSFFFKDTPSEINEEAGFVCDGVVLIVSPAPESVGPMTVAVEFFSLVKLNDGEIGGMATTVYETVIPIAPGFFWEDANYDQNKGLIPEGERAAASALIEELKVLYDQAITNGEIYNDTEETDVKSDESVAVKTADGSTVEAAE